MVLIKQHKKEGNLVLAICDKELIGKSLEEGKLFLDLSSGFYKGKETTEENITALLNVAYIINAVGKESVAFLLKNKIIEESEIKYIQNIPHTQTVLIRDF